MISKKVCMLGGFAVGKTSLVSRFVRSIFSEKYLTTVGVKIDKKTVPVPGNDVDLVLWDIYGEDDFQKMRTSYLRGANGYLLVVDGTRRSTLDTARDLHKLAVDTVGPVPHLVLVNKSDLADAWEVEHRRAQCPGPRRIDRGQDEREERRRRRGSVHAARRRHDDPVRRVMDPTLMDGLLRAFNLMVLERWPDGSFVAVSTPSEWFGAVSRDGTFPFLGAFLEEAGTFWDAADARDGKRGVGAVFGDRRRRARSSTSRRGPSTLGERRFLVFERSDAAVAAAGHAPASTRRAVAGQGRLGQGRARRRADVARTDARGADRAGFDRESRVRGGRGGRSVRATRTSLEAVRVAAATLSSRVDGLVGK